MKFDRTKFFARYNVHFGALSTLQKKGLERLLNLFEIYYGWWDYIPQIANALAQIRHETALSFNPVVEGYYLGNPKAPNFFLGNTEFVRKFQSSLRYFPYFGMGDIQITWEDNYRKHDALVRHYFPEVVRDFEKRTGNSFDIVKHPEQVLDPVVSFCIMTVGMHKGTFRKGQTLDRHINPTHVDHFEARDIVNGDQHYVKDGVKIGTKIKKWAEKFEDILEFSLVSDAGEPFFSSSEIEQAVSVPVPNTATQNRPNIEQENQYTVPDSNQRSATDTPAVPPAPAPGPEDKAQPPVQSPSDNSSFQAETKELDAPAKEGSTTKAAGVTIAGFTVPAGLMTALLFVKSLWEQGHIESKAVLDLLIKFLSENSRYIFYTVIVFVAYLALKKVVKQSTFLVNMVINAIPWLHDIKVVKK